VTGSPLRAPFVMPPFARFAWTSQAARSAWQDRLRSAARGWLEVERDAVAAGLRPASTITMPVEDFAVHADAADTRGIRLLPLDVVAGPMPPLLRDRPSAVLLRCAWTRGGVDVDLQHAWTAGRMSDVATLLGVPACCARAAAHAREAGIVDPTFHVAAAVGAAGRVLDVDAAPPMNPLWRALPLRVLPWLPCSFQCSTSRAIAARMLAFARDAGRADVADTLEEVLAWPAEWSALHGIAEVRTPILKLVTNADALLEKHVVRWTGSGYPAEAPAGTSFPYLSLVQLGGRAASAARRST